MSSLSVQIVGTNGNAINLSNSSHSLVDEIAKSAIRTGSDVIEIKHLLVGLGAWLFGILRLGFCDFVGIKFIDLKESLENNGQNVNNVQPTRISDEVNKVFQKAGELALNNAEGIPAQYVLLAFFELYREDPLVQNLSLAITPEKIMKEFAISLTPKL